MSALDLIDVRKRYGELETLKGIDVTLESGEFLVLLGPSGCGKSTLLNIIAGLIEPSGGDVRIGGRSVLGVHPKDRDIAMVFQSYALYPNLSVARNIGFGLEMRKVPAATREAAVRRVADILQIEPLLSRKPSDLSGGQRQRVAIGRALVRDPAVFLFDEPLSNLDAKLRMETRTELKRLHQKLGTTIVYVTHDQIEAMTLATRIAVMRAGRIEQIGTPEEVYERPANLYVAGFMGSPPMNMLRGTVTPDGAGVTLDGGAGSLTLPASVPRQPGQAVIAGFRPERAGLAAPGEEESLSLRVDVVELTGPEKLVIGQCAGQPVIASLPPRAEAAAGMAVGLRIAAEDWRWFDAASGTALA
jgi:multiple sugar transport system ATP-binding protein